MNAFHSESGVLDQPTVWGGHEHEGVLYTPYMCTVIFLRLCSMVQSMDTKLYLKVEGGAFLAR